ncbi:chromosome condensation complex Condensin, subunit G [Coemansia erecta]|uniref:Chromosome condensation complex Condensin, subunit G n=1 Tax=Coemansia asiatica TaxID=1052880 RepID=A0A9W8CN54_9FUNG|nr:chromosome condensation complex Condensin, subunit G [Coemansia asiatica]KAJ2856579.1 chromosome condensation complex Condensin, subunit G [Coemansia erecta]
MPTNPSKSKGAGPDTISSLRSVIPGIFDAAQHSATGHRKHAVALHKLQEQCHSLDPKDLTGETAFTQEFIRNLNKVLAIKKREPSADKIVKLVAIFVQVGHDMDAKAKTQRNGDSDDVFSDENRADDDEEDADDTMTSRFAETLIRYLLQGFQAKEKMTRMRCCQIVAMSITNLGAIDEDLYFELIRKLIERVRDKESSIRVHAAIALTRLQSNDDVEVNETLVNLMQNDPSAEVRRAVLLNIEKNASTLPFVLERARDVDATNRKCVFVKVMTAIDYRLLSIEDRERLLVAGINDRDSGVRRACVRMVGEGWLTFAGENLLELTAALDVVDSPAAGKVMQALFAAYTEIPENLSFDNELWNTLTPEVVFVIRATLEFFAERHDSDQLDKHLPDGMRLAQLLETMGAKLEAEAEDEQRADHEFVIHQLLLIARMSDFPDELGRRAMLTLMRKMLLVPEIPENNIEAVSDIIRKLSVSEQDFVRIMVEVVSDVREMAPSTSDDLPPERIRLETLLVSIKCLIIIKYILQRCFDSLSDGSAMYALLTECVVPAVQSSETVLQEYGIECLALCCLLDRNLATDNIALFAQAVRQGAGELHARGLAALLDLALMYGIAGLGSALGSSDVLVDILVKELHSEDEKTQATVAEGLARLLYAHRVPEPAPMLEKLLILYYHPDTASNDALRQCLAYFFPAFSYMSNENQVLMQQVAVSTVCKLGSVLKQQSTEGQSGATQGQVAHQIITWCDPRILDAIGSMNSTSMTGSSGGLRVAARMSSYAQIAIDALKKTFTATPNTRKVLVQALNKLAIDDTVSVVQLQQLFVLARTLSQQELVTDMITRNALARFEASLLKLLDVECADGINLEAWLEEPEMASVFEFVSSLDEDAPGDNDEDEDEEEDGNDDGDGRGSAVTGSDSEASESRMAEERVLPAMSLRSRMPVPAKYATRSPMKRAREERLEELTREIDELLESDDEDEDNEYLSS